MHLKQAMDIIRLALQVNGMEAREFNDKPSVFFLMAGNVARVHIRIYKEGYPKRKRCVKVFEFYLDEPLDESDYLDYCEYMYRLIRTNDI